MLGNMGNMLSDEQTGLGLLEFASFLFSPSYQTYPYLLLSICFSLDWIPVKITLGCTNVKFQH